MATTKQLYDLFLLMFDNDGLRKFLTYQLGPEGKRISYSIPSSGSPSSVMFEAVQVLRRHGMIDADLFKALYRHSPKLRTQLSTAQSFSRRHLYCFHGSSPPLVYQ